MANWSIPTSRLTGFRRRGGAMPISGLAFQDAYVCLYMTYLLDSTRGIAALRYEGSQDVDLLYVDGREEYVQIKNEPNAHYTLDKLRPILQSFAIDFLEAGRPTSLTFTLVARSNYINAAVGRVRDREARPQDIAVVADLLAKSTKTSPAPECILELSEDERYDLSKQLLKQTKFLFGMGDKIDGRLSFESHAYAELAGYGITGSELQDAFNALNAGLYPQREFTRVDVEELVKRFISVAAIELFEGRVELLTDHLLSHSADSDRIQQFYAGAPLDWDIIAARGDIERDQQQGLVEQLSMPSEALRLFCIVAEPGAGKSTLAWRVAAELHSKYGALVIRIRDREDADVWYSMIDFCQKVRRPFYVLADDLFRAPAVVSALRELNPSLSTTILATSRSNEYHRPRLKGETVLVPLKRPSPDEKDQILKRLGKTRSDLSPEQQRRLDTANQFLVLMMEVTADTELREIIRDTLERLRALDENAYRAYEYLCFICQYDMVIPMSLLERLDAQGRFHDLPRRETVRGLVFYDEDREGYIRTGHPLIAEAAYSFYGIHRSTASVLREVVSAVDTANYFERTFTFHLLRKLAEAKSPVLESAMPHIRASIEQCQRDATRVIELANWASF